MDRNSNLANASGRAGYRLERAELLNWGTFDGKLHVIRPNGATTLLVGRNGSGKSTIVDAFLTLLVKPGVRNFNVAAGAKKTERDERSYIKGAYDRTENDAGHVELKFLRPNPVSYSIILACFHSEATQRRFTVAQLLYLGADQSTEKVYCFSEDARFVTADLSGLGAPDVLVRGLRERGWRTTRVFNEYEAWLLKRVHAKKKAMEVLNQTVAVKDIQRLNDFIRQHMLEPQPWSEKVDHLLGHFAQLREAHQSLVRVREQLELLQPIARFGAAYREKSEQLERTLAVFDAIDSYFADRTVTLIVPYLGRLDGELADARRSRESLGEQQKQAQGKVARLENEIENAGGQRLRDIPVELAAELKLHAVKLEANRQFCQLLWRAGLERAIEDESAFDATRAAIAELQHELEQEQAELRAQQEPLIIERAAIRSRIEETDRELKSLEQRRENLPAWCVSVREVLCRQLGLATKELPFVAELVAVAPYEEDWQASIEKVLRPLALSLLLPERLYRLVSGYIERTKLQDSLSRGARLTYLRIGGVESADQVPPPSADSMLHKIAFREGHALTPWVKAELRTRYDYKCCDTLDEFQQARGLAMTRSRHLKQGGRRHEKDDTERAIDPSNFVLGWDNQEKQRRLRADFEALTKRALQLNEAIDGVERVLSRSQGRIAILTEAAQLHSFLQLDFRTHETTIAKLEREKLEIENSSQTIVALRRQKQELETVLEELQQMRDDAIRSVQRLERDSDDANRLLGNAKRVLEERELRGSLKEDRERFTELDRLHGDAPLTAYNIAEHREAAKTLVMGRADTIRKNREPIGSDLLQAMAAYLRHFPDEHDLAARLEFLDDYLGVLDRIVTEDLPRHERRFKDRLNEKVLQEIGLFRGELERERRDIDDKIDTLNLSLRRLQYRPGTHIRLEPRPVRDAEIAEFQTKLRECIEGSFDDTSEGNEARFVRIQVLLARLGDESNRRWRDKVTDVRRWFDFAATVIDEESNKVISVYQDSTGQSGGEKAKLAFTILVAAIGYQYDLDPDAPKNDRLCFVLVDEMFSKVDDQHAEYALDLFRQFGLQLLIVAPLDAKARVTQSYVGCYLHVNKRDNRSEIFEMTAVEFDDLAAGKSAIPTLPKVVAAVQTAS